MTASVLENTQPIPVGVPDHTATPADTDIPLVVEGEKGSTRPGIFGRVTGTGGSSRMRKGPGRPPKETAEVPKLAPHMKKKITDFYILVGGLITPFDQLTGQQFIDQAPKCGAAVYDFAQENAMFRRVLQGFLTTSMWGALIFAHLPIILVALRHSKRDGVRFTAASMMVALKLMEQSEAEEAFAPDEDDAEVPTTNAA